MSIPSTEDIAWYGTKRRAIEAMKEEEKRIEDLQYQSYVKEQKKKESKL